MVWVKGNGAQSYAGATMSVLDSPATTSATTYKVQLRRSAGTGYTFWGGSDAKTSITVFEVKG
jgi:hypothetical protein